MKAVLVGFFAYVLYSLLLYVLVIALKETGLIIDAVILTMTGLTIVFIHSWFSDRPI